MQERKIANEVLLMTGTINPGNTDFVKIKDPKERLFDYICSLIAWIDLTNIKTIVFCENSNSNCDFLNIVNYAQQQGKKLEILVFEGNQKAQKYGKGYGEGKIIEYAIKHSAYLSDNQNFYKITGRYFVENFDLIQQDNTERYNIFIRPDVFLKNKHIIRRIYMLINQAIGYLIGSNRYRMFGSLPTFFYKATVEFYKTNLIDSYKKINEAKLITIEKIFYNDLLRKEYEYFLTDIRIIGKRGATGLLIDGLDYDEEIKEKAQKLMSEM